MRAVAPSGAELNLGVAASTGCELLIELSVLAGERDRGTLDPERRQWTEAAAAAMPAALRRTLARVGDRSGEVWLHLLGLALEAPPPRDAAALRERVAGADPLTVRRHLVGALLIVVWPVSSSGLIMRPSEWSVGRSAAGTGRSCGAGRRGQLR